MSAHNFFGSNIPDFEYIISQLHYLTTVSDLYQTAEVKDEKYAIALLRFRDEKIEEIKEVLSFIYQARDQIDNYTEYVKHPGSQE